MTRHSRRPRLAPHRSPHARRAGTHESLGRRLQQAEAGRRELFDASPDALLIFDASTLALLDHNRAAQALYGPALGDPQLTLRTLAGPEEHRAPALWNGLQLDGAGRSFRAELRLASLEHRGRPALLFSVRDVEEQTRLERERHELQERVRRSQRMDAVGRLVSGLAHDLNNLLAVISVNLDFLGDGSEELRQIREANRRGAAMLRQLLRLGRRGEVATGLVDPSLLLGEVAQLLGRLLGERHRVVVVPSAQGLSVQADPDQLSQVLLNLLLNARDAMPDGGEILLGCEEVQLGEELPFHGGKLAAGRYACLSVRDAGVGMAPEVLARLFEPFFTTKPEGRGTGLGLATSYGIVRDAGGAVLAESRPGQGSVFRVLLPAAAGAVPVQPPPRVRRGRGEKLLLVEPDGSLRALLVRLLEGQGYAVEARSGEQPLGPVAEEGPFAAVLCSLGHEQAARAVAPLSPLLILTSTGAEPRTAGTVLHKPFSTDELLAAVATTLRSAQARPGR